MSDTGAVTMIARRGRARGTLRWPAASGETVGQRARVVGLEPRGPDFAPVEVASVHGQTRAPGDDGELTLTLALHRYTLAGQYPARLVIGTREVALTVVVPVEQRLRLTPSVFHVDPGAATPIELVVAAENLGNVPLVLQHPQAEVLERRRRFCGVARTAVALAAAEVGKPAHEALAGAVIQAAAKSFAADPIVAARLEGSPVLLNPGETRALRLRIRLPSRLDEGRYQAKLGLGPGAWIRIHVLSAKTTAEGGDT